MNAAEKIAQFFHHYPERTYQKGDVIIQAGSVPPAYYIVEGSVAQYDISESGDKLIVNIYKAGAYISLASILNSLPSDFFFEASSDVVARQAPAKAVATFLKQNIDVTYDALARISRGSSGLMLRLARVMEGDAEGRILQELEIMRKRFAHDSAEVKITKSELAAQTGLARETVSRALKRLSTQGIIKSGRGTIELL